MSGDDLFSAPKASWSFFNSYLQHSLDSDCLPVLEMLWSTSYSEPLPAVPNTTAYSFHVPGPCTWPLSFLPRGDGAACPMGHAPYSGDPQTVPRGFLLQHMSQLLCHRPPAEPPPVGTAYRRRSNTSHQKDSWGTSLHDRASLQQHATA